MKEIQLTQGKVAIVDDDDFNRLSQWKWCYDGVGYAYRRKTISKNNSISWRMHWEIVDKPRQGMCIDHINGNKLDNRKYNLRIVTQSQNKMNSVKHIDNTSGHKGVTYLKCGQRKKRWLVQIMVNGKRISIGYFLNKEDAAKAYNDAAKKYFGEFAKLNLIEQ